MNDSRATRTQTVLRTLEEEIVSGRLRPRDRLVETDLAARFGVSRAPVREALGQLERDGLVERETRGLQVSDVSLEEAAEIFEVLADLEEIYTRRATPYIDASGLRRMDGLLKQMQDCVERSDVKAYFDLNDAFHQVIRDACPNRTLIRLLGSLGKKTVRFRVMAMSLPGRLPLSIDEHHQIRAAIKDGHHETAGRLARESADNAYRALTQFLSHVSIAG